MMKNLNSILIAAGAGICVGGILGILFAPDKGSSTRDKIAYSGKKMSENLNNSINKGKERVSDWQEGIKERLQTVSDNNTDLI
jgi:gas vesicle protein